MRVCISEKMKTWVAAYIRAHRTEGAIAIHVVYSKFNEDFRTTFKVDPITAVHLMIGGGLLKGRPAKGGFIIWLPEDESEEQRHVPLARDNVAGPITTTNQTPQTQPTTLVQNGESEMWKKREVRNDTAIESLYSFERVPHPETGEVDVLELIKYIMHHIASKLPQKPEMDGGYALMKLNLSKEGQECGLTAGDMVRLSAIMQHMALVKHYDRLTWGVLHTKAANYFITPRAYIIARKKWREGAKRNEMIAQLRRQQQRQPIHVADATASNHPTTMFDDEALEILFEAEELARKLEKAKTRIKELEVEKDKLQAELAKRPTSSDAAREALKERLAALKKASSA